MREAAKDGPSTGLLRTGVQRYRADTYSAGRRRSDKAGTLSEGSTDATRRNMRQRKGTAYPNVDTQVQPHPCPPYAARMPAVCPPCAGRVPLPATVGACHEDAGRNARRQGIGAGDVHHEHSKAPRIWWRRAFARGQVHPTRTRATAAGTTTAGQTRWSVPLSTTSLALERPPVEARRGL